MEGPGRITDAAPPAVRPCCKVHHRVGSAQEPFKILAQ
jgi:hypothetical protein